MGPDRLHILTGAPGSGKSAILEGLGDGVHTVGEPAREVIAEQRATIGRHRHLRADPALFVALLLAAIDRTSIATAMRLGGARRAVRPRGARLRRVRGRVGRRSAGSLAAARRYRYHREVMILEPWGQIYATDAERTMSFEQTIPFHEALVDAYEGAGYALVRCPPGSSRSGSPSSATRSRGDRRRLRPDPTGRCFRRTGRARSARRAGLVGATGSAARVAAAPGSVTMRAASHSRRRARRMSSSLTRTTCGTNRAAIPSAIMPARCAPSASAATPPTSTSTGFPGRERPRQGRASLGLDADDAGVGRVPGGDARDQTTAADRNDDGVQRRGLAGQLGGQACPARPRPRAGRTGCMNARPVSNARSSQAAYASA